MRSKKLKLTTGQLRRALWPYLRFRFTDCAIFPEMYVGEFERDFVIVNPKHNFYEVEMKASRNDFRAELKHKKDKHDAMAKDYMSWQIPKYYWFACPAQMIQPDEVPPYSGLLWIDELGGVTTVKKVKSIKHATELPDWLLFKMVRKCSWKEYDRFTEHTKKWEPIHDPTDEPAGVPADPGQPAAQSEAVDCI